MANRIFENMSGIDHLAVAQELREAELSAPPIPLNLELVPCEFDGSPLEVTVFNTEMEQFVWDAGDTPDAGDIHEYEVMCGVLDIDPNAIEIFN